MRTLAYACSVIAAILLFEILAQALFFSREGELLWNHDAEARQIQENRLDSFDRKIGLPGLRLHPTFGWATVSGTPGYNDQGFLSDRQYPYAPADHEYVVGVFGGSMAVNFWAHNRDTKTFQNILRAQVPGLGERQVVLLNFAKEGYRQPQQLAILNHYILSGQDIDLVLNINGYNEITGTWVNRMLDVAFALPTANLLFEFAQLTQADGIGSSAAFKVVERSLQARANDQIFATFWLGLKGLSRIAGLMAAESDAVQNSVYEARSNLMFVPTQASTGDRAEFLEDFMVYWTQSSKLMEVIAHASGAKYLQVLQPNQYVRTARRFTDEEKAIAFADHNAYDGLINTAYKRIQAERDRAAASGNFLDATTALDAISETVYVDNCCHMNTLGRNILSQFVAQAAARTIGTATEREDQ